jgi:luciferase family oxidoreductase group 1
LIPFSVLDLAFVTEGSTPREALSRTLDLAQHAERWGYLRFWLAEHHNMIGVASAATSVVIGHVAGGTHTIRVGAGGIMLPNHSPLVIAEHFGTLETLYPGRIDLGLGRAPGTDGRTLRSLRRDPLSSDQFPQDVLELQAFFAPPQPGQAVQAVPGAGLNVPIWILGSSLFGAQLAAAMGLPYAYAAHFSPGNLEQALKLYREGFKPSPHLDRPYAMIGINAIAADTDAEARRLFTSSQQAFTNMTRNARGRLQPPIDDIDAYWRPEEKSHVSAILARAVVGSVETVRESLKNLVAETGPDELMLVSAIFDHRARLRSYELFSEIQQSS